MMCVLHRYILNKLLKFIAIAKGFFLDARTIIVDRIGRIIEEFGNAGTLLNAQSYERKDAQVGSQLSAVGNVDTMFGLEQRIEIIDKIGKKMKKDGIKIVE